MQPLARGAVVPAGGEAQVTRLRKEVKILSPKGAAHSASLRENLPDGASVRTGIDSQSEVTFADHTLARLAAQTVFAFNDGTHAMDLEKGAMLVRAPGSAHGAEIRAAGVTVAVAGTTCLLEHNAGKYVKLMVLEGTARMFLKTSVGESVLVNEGQLLMFHLGPKLSSLPNPVDVDIKRMMATSKLIQGFAPLGSESSIARGIAEQKQEKTKGALVDTNLVIFGRGTVVSLVEPAAASPSPSPPKQSRRARNQR
ncbi:MAG: FecR domain-containing protein [Chthoniobacterales bacterium]